MQLFHASLHIKILIGMVLGILSGVFFGEYNLAFDTVGKAFITLLRMTILPYVSIALIHGIGSLTRSSSKLLLKRGSAFLVIFWAVTIVSIYLISLSFPSLSTPLYHGSLATVEKAPSIINFFIPANPFRALVNDMIPAVVLFSLLFGIALMQLSSKSNLLTVLETILSALMTIMRWVCRLSPIGVFALIATTAGTLSFHEFNKISGYLLSYISIASILVFWIFPTLVTTLTSVSYRHFMKELRAPLLLAFTTGNVLIVLPFIIELIKNIASHFKITKEESHKTLATAIPILYNFPSAGNLLVMLFVLFTSSFYAHPFTFFDHGTFIFSSLFSLFGSASTSINAVIFLLDKMHLPYDAISLFFSVMPLTRHFQAMATCVGLTTVSLLILFATKGLISFNKNKIIKNSAITVCALIITALIIRNITSVESLPSSPFSSFSLQESVPAEMLLSSKKASHRPFTASLNYIKKSHFLRVGIVTDTKPFVYLNAKSDLVGHDIAIIHKLAHDLECRIEFIPYPTYKELLEGIEKNNVDVAVGGITVTGDRLKEVNFTEPYMRVEKALIVQDHRRHDFASQEKVQQYDDITIATLQGSAYESIAKEFFPKATVITLPSYDDLLGREDIDAFFSTKEEGIPWVLTNPTYTVVTPHLGEDFYAFAVHKKSDELLSFINYWLDLKKLDETMEQEYTYWIEGDVMEKTSRWSVIKDVLHLVN
jgi:Na+/H+-dicarboxylate symporter